VDLKLVPLKYEGLSPWQIWLSESQERMTLAVPKKNWAAFKKIMDRYGVEATRIGEFTKTGKCVVRFRGEVVMDMSLSFLHDGRPVQIQRSRKKESGSKKAAQMPNVDVRKAMLDVLARPSVGSTAFIAAQYDHEVQGMSVTKPLQGRGRVNAESGVLKPLPGSKRGVVLSHGYCPWYSTLDTYAMAAAAIDTAVRNAVCAGASRDYLAILDNFCWSSSEKPERLWELKQAAKACYDIATRYGTPFISGKDSMHNDFRGFDDSGKPVHIAALPTLLVSAIGVVPDIARAMTLDFKEVGDGLYIVGKTNDELGASEYFEYLGAKGGSVPVVDAKQNARSYDAVTKAIEKGLIASAIGVGRGGLAAALAKSAVGGQLGFSANLTSVPGEAKRADSILFSESQGRVLLSVRKGKEKEFERTLQGTAYARLGEVSKGACAITIGKEKFEYSISALTESYRSFFKHW